MGEKDEETRGGKEPTTQSQSRVVRGLIENDVKKRFSFEPEGESKDEESRGSHHHKEKRPRNDDVRVDLKLDKLKE